MKNERQLSCNTGLVENSFLITHISVEHDESERDPQPAYQNFNLIS